MKFNEFGLKPNILKGIEKLGFEKATEIQEKAIPFLLGEERDLIGLAQTGTGKTAAFGLPLLHSIDVTKVNVQGIILCPTRELCMQLANELENYSVGTPGRTLDLIKRKKLHLDSISTVIFDEADEMLSMGFKDDMDEILKVTPDEKRTLLFSATMPDEIRRMSKKYMHEPHEIAVMHKNQSNDNVEHFYYEVSARRKYEVLSESLIFTLISTRLFFAERELRRKKSQRNWVEMGTVQMQSMEIYHKLKEIL